MEEAVHRKSVLRTWDTVREATESARITLKEPRSLLYTILRLHLTSKRVNVGGNYFEIILTGNKRHVLTLPCTHTQTHTRTSNGFYGSLVIFVLVPVK